MPAIFFADLDALRLALASGAVPPAVARAPARAGFDAAGRLWLQPTAPLPRDAVAALARLGAAVQGASGIDLTEDVPCWPHLLPLVPIDGEAPAAVLFELPDAERLPQLTAELRRLGAGKVVCRIAPDHENDQAKPSHGNGWGQAYVLAERPPFATLLRTDIRGYAQRAPRVWVELGSRHPVAELIEPPDGQIVLLRPPREWRFLDDVPFPAGPDHFALPSTGTSPPAAAARPLSVGLRLVPARSAEPAELWVFAGTEFPRLRALVEQSDDRLIARLSLAVGTAGGQRVAVLRARPGKHGPPVLVLDAVAYRPHLRLPNLFVPVGERLTPPLRRDAVRELLAPDPSQVVWLEPTADGFAPQSLPMGAFHPLEQYVAYTRDHPAGRFVPDDTARPFAFQPFEARELLPPPSRRAPKPVTPRVGPAKPVPPAAPAEPKSPGLLQRVLNWLTPAPRPPQRVSTPRSESVRGAADSAPAPVNDWDERRRTLEGQVLVAAGLPDASQTALWPDLAAVYTAIDQPADAAVCWLNALWERDALDVSWANGWLRAEARLPRGTATADDLRRWLAGPPSHQAVRAVAAYTVWAAAQESPPADLGRIQRLLDENESALPVRAAWLARLALGRLAGGDTIGLARARDRLLERLYEGGLSVDRDVPTFLRFAGQGSGERLQAVREWLAKTREPVHRWLTERASAAGPGLPNLEDVYQSVGGGPAGSPLRFTRAYADLTLAWGLARLGERALCQEVTGQARAVLAGQDDAHDILLAAYGDRIRQALEGRTGGPLPVELLARLTELGERERTDAEARRRALRYKVERLVQHSRILEPVETIDPFHDNVLIDYGDELQRALAAARAVTDRGDLARRLNELVAAHTANRDELVRVLEVALDRAPRLGDTFARAAIDRLVGVVDRLTFAGRPEAVIAQVRVLERGLLAAAHFDHADAAGRLIAAVGRLLDARPSGDGPDGWQRAEDTLVKLVGQGIRSLRRLGQRAEADALLDRVAEWVAPGGDLSPLRRRPSAQWAGVLRRLLALVGGWFYVGRDDPATQALDEARRALFSPELLQPRDQTNLACAYVAALGHAPPRLAMGRVEEVFQRLQGVSDRAFTATHYSLAQLRLVEAAVLAVVNDDFALGPRVRRWLDEDEYVVRRRIHADVRAAVG
ncbi:MAG: hypothetical protein U0746_17345 [Gemmataceae bacterium]